MATNTDATVDEYGSNIAVALMSSVINANTTLDGKVNSSTDLRIEGRVSGVIECEGILYVSQGAVIDATVEAGGIVVEGSLSGTILCHGRLEIRSTGIVAAEVDTQRLVIHEGAVYEGRLRMDSTEPGFDNATIEPAAADTSDETTSSASPFPYLRFSQPASLDEQDDAEPMDSDPGIERDRPSS
ncbi:MAG TPA: polymer-forming cytoskeletal protein [Thermomicrobiales bacterium]|nr:polymer-forming cytoskeletal protein [Thermomicrobiales bacterium]